MVIRIHNIREGFATNSSSTHSLISFTGAIKPKDNYHPGDFGRDWFILASKKAKRTYAATSIYESLWNQKRKELQAVSGEWPKLELEVHREMVREACRLVEIEPEDLDPEFYKEDRGYIYGPHIDHYSDGTVPALLDPEELRKMLCCLDQDEIIILGGNDNDPNIRKHPVKQSQSAKDVIIIKDDNGFWKAFDPNTGLKVRWTEGEDQPAPEKASFPELIDVKITDYCPYSCEFCYQGSTTGGKHARLESIRKLAEALKYRVFEVAIGGGEPTLHPDFKEILKVFDESRIKANFTTKSLAWLKNENEEEIEDILNVCGAFAVSVDNVKEVREAIDVVEHIGSKDCFLGNYLFEKLMFQHIVGLDETPETFRELLDEVVSLKKSINDWIHPGITLLGYKTTGRGLMYQPKPNPDWIQVVKEVVLKHGARVGIDTVLVERHWNQLLDAGVPEWCMAKKEGKFSCYIDFVENKIAPSSYCDKSQVKELVLTREGIMEAFEGF